MQLWEIMPQDRPSWRCVVDPLLAFKPYGVPLIRHLSCEMEVWIARELWHILNDVAFYLQKPGLLNPTSLWPQLTVDQEYYLLHGTVQSLLQWEQLRRTSDLSRLRFFWVGDSLKESFLPSSIHPSWFQRWESAGSLLDHYLSEHNVQEHVLSLALRDAIALSASLESAFILAAQPVTPENTFCPAICRILVQWGIQCCSLSPEDPTVLMEREFLRRYIVEPDMAKSVWQNVPLAVVHLLAPALWRTQASINRTQDEDTYTCRGSAPNQEILGANWSEAKAYWYVL